MPSALDTTPRKECLGSTFNVSEEENRGIHLFRLLVSNPSLLVRAHDRGELEHEKIRLSVFQSPDSISVVVAKIIVKHRYPAIEPATLIEYAARLTSSKKNYEAGRPGHQAIKHYYDHQEIPTKPTTMLGDPSMLLPRPGEVSHVTVDLDRSRGSIEIGDRVTGLR